MNDQQQIFLSSKKITVITTNKTVLNNTIAAVHIHFCLLTNTALVPLLTFQKFRPKR